jgi:hypothetical protein
MSDSGFPPNCRAVYIEMTFADENELGFINAERSAAKIGDETDVIRHWKLFLSG